MTAHPAPFDDRERLTRATVSALRDEIETLRAEISALRDDLDERSRAFDDRQRVVAAHLSELDQRGAELAISRQVRRRLSPLARAARRTTRTRQRLLIIVGHENDLLSVDGRGPVATRARLAPDEGVDVMVFVPSGLKRGSVAQRIVDGTIVFDGPMSRLDEVLRRSDPDVLGVHRPRGLRVPTTDLPTIVWLGGAEAMSWRDLRADPGRVSRSQRSTLDSDDVPRRNALANLIEATNRTVVFTSDHVRGATGSFVGADTSSGLVIPDPVDIDTFAPSGSRDDDPVTRVLWARGFDDATDANDLSSEVVQRLAASDDAARFAITVVGGGAEFDDVVEPLRSLPMVHVERRALGPVELSDLHSRHDIALAPVRRTTVTPVGLEAMSSGLVVVTNRIDTVTEAIPDDAAAICPEGDVDALVDAIRDVADDRERRRATQSRAREAVVSRHHPDLTVRRECELVREMVRSAARRR